MARMLRFGRGSRQFRSVGLAHRYQPGGADLPGATRTLPCRPTIACTADIVPPGAFELEAGALFRRLGSAERQWTFPFLSKLTIASWLQLQVGSNGYSVAYGKLAAQFLDNVEVGGKFHFIDSAGDFTVELPLALNCAV